MCITGVWGSHGSASYVWHAYTLYPQWRLAFPLMAILETQLAGVIILAVCKGAQFVGVMCQGR